MKIKKIRSFSVLLLATLLVSCSNIANLFAPPTPTPTLTPTLTPTPSPTPFPLLGKSLLDVTYCTMDGSPQKLDIYFPDQGGPWPVVVYVHGGSWMTGDKAEAAGLAKWLNPLGYVVVSLNYRMYPAVRFPALIEDPKCGLRFLRAHAVEYNLDPKHFAAWGASAGGHLVALIGTSDASAGWDVGEYPDQSSRVQAVVDMSGPSDLTKMYPNYSLATVIMMAFGIKPELRVLSSPITYATADDPPFLVIHGDKDPVVPVDQGQLMYAALIKAGVSAKLVIVKNGLHDLTAAGAAPTSPTQDEINQMLLDFLAETLKGK
jgi:acetyl esterase/lipase